MMESGTVRLPVAQSEYRPMLRELHRFIVRPAALLFSFESVFVLFIFAGIYKADSRFSWIPVDVTLLLMLLSVAMGTIILIRRKFKVNLGASKIVAAYVLFAVFAVASLWWTEGYGYAREKALELLSVVVWIVVAGALIVSQEPDRVRRLLTAMVLFSIWIAIEGHIAYLHTEPGWTIVVMNGTYLGVGRVVGAGAMIALGFVLFSRSPVWMRLAAFGIYGYFIYVLLLVGGRGPFLAAALGTLLPVLFSVRLAASRIKLRGFGFLLVLIIAFAACFTAYLLVSGESVQTLDRLQLLFGGGQDLGESANTRTDYYADSIRLWRQNPWFGSGIGSFPAFYGYVDEQRLYPHNLFLEVAVELGAVGLLLLLALLGAGLRYNFPVRRLHREPYKLIPLMLLVNAFVNAQVSGDLSDNRFLFGLLGIMPFLHADIAAPGEELTDAT